MDQEEHTGSKVSIRAVKSQGNIFNRANTSRQQEVEVIKVVQHSDIKDLWIKIYGLNTNAHYSFHNAQRFVVVTIQVVKTFMV